MSIHREKYAVLSLIRERLHHKLTTANQAVLQAQEEANHHVGAMESRYDTFKEEAQYLATAQTIRSYQIQADLDECERLIERISGSGLPFSIVESGALVTLSNDDAPESRKTFFIVPDGAGDVVTLNGRSAICVGVGAPVVLPFLGLEEGDYCAASAADNWTENAYIESIS